MLITNQIIKNQELRFRRECYRNSELERYENLASEVYALAEYLNIEPTESLHDAVAIFAGIRPPSYTRIVECKNCFLVPVPQNFPADFTNDCPWCAATNTDHLWKYIAFNVGDKLCL